MHGSFSEPAILGQPMDFNLLFRREHQPAFLHAGGGIRGKFGAVVIMAGHANFNDKLGGVRMVETETFFAPTHDRQVWLRLRIVAADRLFGPQRKTRRHKPKQGVMQKLHEITMKW